MNQDNHRLLEQFMQINWLLMRRHHHHHPLGIGTGNPYRGQGRVLKLLKLKPEITQKELSELLDMRPQSLGDLLQKLEQKGCITRTPSESDKRAMLIRLTEKGANEELDDVNPSGYDALFQCLSEEEQQCLGEYLGRLIEDWRGDDARAMHFGDYARHRHHDHHH